MRRAPVPVPAVLWHRHPVLPLARVKGCPLGGLGEPSTASAAAWAAAGAVARSLHDAPLPPWAGWQDEEFAAFVDAECGWLLAAGVAGVAVRAARRAADVALRPWRPVFTHGDLQAAHVFVDGDAVTGVLDWADACVGDALFDLAVLTVGHPEHLDDVVRGYGHDADVDCDVVRSWWAVRRLCSIRWMVEHGFDARGDVAMLDSYR